MPHCASHRVALAAALVAATSLAAFASPARAAAPVVAATAQVPARAPDVGSIDARLLAEVRGNELCLQLEDWPAREPDSVPWPEDTGLGTSTESDLNCSEVPRDDVLRPLHHKAQAGAGVAVGGAVRSDVAAVELIAPGGGVTRLPTVPAPAALAGTRAADLRFYVGAPPARVATWRLVGFDGQLLHEQDDEWEGRLVRRAQRVASGSGWQVTVDVRRSLAPVRGDAGRRVRTPCLIIRHQIERSGYSEGRDCFDATSAPGPFVVPQEGCGRIEHVVLGFVRRGEAPRSIVTTAGRTRPFRVLRLPPGYGGDPTLRVALATGGPGAGIRSVVEASGAVSRYDIEPPQLRSCTVGGGRTWQISSAGAPPLGGDAVVRPAGPAGPRIFVRDLGERLCIAFERSVRAPDCRVPSPTLWFGDVETFRGATMAVGFVDARVARVRVSLSTGARVEVPTAVDPAYTGRYAGSVAFFAYIAPPGATIGEARPIAPHGTELPGVGRFEPVLTAPVRTVAIVPGHRRTRLVSAPTKEGFECLILLTGGAPTVGEECPLAQLVPDQVEAEVRCGRDLRIHGMAGSGARSVMVVLAGGRRIVRPVTRVGGRRGTYVDLTVPRHAEISRIELRGRGAWLLHRYPFPAPPASEQCGYTAAVEPFLP